MTGTRMTGPDCAVMCNLINTLTHTRTHHGRKLADYFQPWGQYGVAVSGGVEIMALTAILGFEEGCTILSYDGANAFNSIYRHIFLPAQRKSFAQWSPTHQTCTHGNPQNSCLHLMVEAWKWLSQHGEYRKDAI